MNRGLLFSFGIGIAIGIGIGFLVHRIPIAIPNGVDGRLIFGTEAWIQGSRLRASQQQPGEKSGQKLF
jgi:hypothetical protein